MNEVATKEDLAKLSATTKEDLAKLSADTKEDLKNLSRDISKLILENNVILINMMDEKITKNNDVLIPLIDKKIKDNNDILIPLIDKKIKNNIKDNNEYIFENFNDQTDRILMNFKGLVRFRGDGSFVVNL